MLDAQASSICSLLASNGVIVPKFLQIPLSWKTLYYYVSPWNTQNYLDFLYDIGFTDTDECSGEIYPPVERVAVQFPIFRPDLPFLWFLKKGVNLDFRCTYRPHHGPKTSQSYPFLNVITWALAEWISDRIMTTTGRLEQLDISFETPRLPYESPLTSWWMDITIENDDPVIHAGPEMCALLKSSLTSEAQDICVCSCFREGCTPAFVMLKRLYDPDFDRDNYYDWRQIDIRWIGGGTCSRDCQRKMFYTLCKNRPRKVFRAISSFLESDQQRLQWSLSLIRFETFTRLQLRHTCY